MISLQLVFLRSCGCGVAELEQRSCNAWSGMECCTFFGVAGFAP